MFLVKWCKYIKMCWQIWFCFQLNVPKRTNPTKQWRISHRILSLLFGIVDIQFERMFLPLLIHRTSDNSMLLPWPMNSMLYEKNEYGTYWKSITLKIGNHLILPLQSIDYQKYRNGILVPMHTPNSRLLTMHKH